VAVFGVAVAVAAAVAQYEHASPFLYA
jgi:hypothetical protein